MDYTIITDKIESFVENKVVNAIKTKKWKELFVETGEFLLDSPETEKAFVKDLQLVLSQDNMKELAKEMENESGVVFLQKFRREMKKLFHKYELDEYADSCVSIFEQRLMQYFRENDPQKELAIFLSEWEERSQSQLQNIQETGNNIINEIKKLNQQCDIYTIIDIENEIKKYAKYNKMDLSFYELDDDQFTIRFQRAISDQENTIVSIEGISREETLYRVLNYLKQNNPSSTVLIVKSADGWGKLQKENKTGRILIPYFFADSINAIAGNINIFIHNDEEPSRSTDKIELHRRTKRNILKSLESIGIEYDKAYRLFEKTHGLYAPLKRALFNTETMPKPAWTEEDQQVILTALLCGKWTDNDGDKEVIENLSGKSYDDFMTVLRKHENGEEPFIITISVENKKIYQIASIEEAWVLLRRYIKDDLRKKYIKLFCDVLKQEDPIQERIQDCDIIIRNNYTDKVSKVLKSGMIRSFILWTYIDANKADQLIIDNAVKDVLNSIDNVAKWNYISDYIVELCEASPEAVLFKIEEEIKNPKGMEELFSKNTNYTSILWAVEQLIQQNAYVTRAIKWLWEMDSKNYQYKISNSPRSVLEVVFCVWFNVSPLSKDDKIREAGKALHQYKNAWDIISECLPELHPSIIGSLSKPTYKEFYAYEEAALRSDAYEIYHAYLDLCVETIDNSPQKWIKILEKLTYYEKKTIADNLVKLVEYAKKMDDEDKTAIKGKLMHIVHQHRHFADADWAMKEDQIQLFEQSIDMIIVNNRVYDYLYLFQPDHDFPLLHPIPYDRDHYSDQHDKNEDLVNEERKNKIQEFKDNNYSVEQLIEYGMKKEREGQIGYVLAHYYDQGHFNEKVFSCLVHQEKNSTWQVVNYVRHTIHNLSELKKTIQLAKTLDVSIKGISDIISLQLAETIEDTIIFTENDDIKKAFWTWETRFQISRNAPKNVLIRAIEECFKWGCFGTYMEMLYDYKDSLTVEELYEFFLRIISLQNFDRASSAKWYFKEVMEILQNAYINDDERCFQIARMEWWSGNLIDESQMLCTYRLIKQDPRVYAGLVNIVCKKDTGASNDPEKRDRATKLFGRFMNIHFCPAEKDGHVIYEELKKWVDDFKVLLEKQDQRSLWEILIGELLPYSPDDKDGTMPCEAVRKLIEEYYTEKMARSYTSTVFNMRGVYTPNGGKGEEALADKYEKNAEKIEKESPFTAKIYRDLSNEYRVMAARERTAAEDVW